MNDIKRTAIHEAAHAVVARLFNIPVDTVTIVPTDDSWGHMRWIPPDGFDPDEEDHIETVHRTIMVKLAGPASEEIAFGQSGDGCGHDFDTAVDIACYITGNDEELQRIYDEKWEQTKQLLSEHWSTVEALAEQLLIHKTLDGNQVHQLMAG